MDNKLAFGIVLATCLCWQASATINCSETGAGRFTDDTTCKNYTLCVYVSSNTSYVSYDYVCPTTSIFDTSSSQCTGSSTYTCNVTSTNTTTSVCTADGYFADSTSTNCSSYIECVEINGTYTETTYTCPDATYFNPNTTLCESDYNCTSTTTEFSCTAAGRFADSSDTTCQTYYLCVLSGGEYIMYTYTCPTTSVFSPTTKVCTTSYTCPTA